MKLAHITSFYPWALDRIYSTEPGLSSRSYDEQLASLMAVRFGWSDVWSHALRPHGFEVSEFVLNARALQTTWLRENGSEAEPADWKLDCIRAQVASLQPEIIFLDDYNAFSTSELQSIRQSSRATKLMVGWCGAPFRCMTQFAAFDLVLSNIRGIVDELNQAGCKSEHMRHAFDSRIQIEPIPVQNAARRITFCGGVSSRSGWHKNRLKYLQDLTEHIPMAIASELYWRVGRLTRLVARASCAASYSRCVKRGIDGMLNVRTGFLGAPLTAALEPPRLGIEMYKFLAGSTATFNIHIARSGEEASNMRLFEATGVGACLVTDNTDNLREIFEPDREVVCYQSLDECREKMNWLLNNQSAAREIGLRARRRTLNQHTFAARAPYLHDIFLRHM